MSQNVPVNTKPGDLFLARFAGYPLWPVRILESVPTSKGPTKYHVFCYGKKHDRQLVTSEQLVSYKDNVTEASAKKTRGVDIAFDELRDYPDVYKQYLKGSNTAADCAAELRNLVNATEQDLLATKKNLSETIEKKIAEKLKSTGSTPAASTAKFPTETMVSEIHDAMIIEFSPKFNIIEKQLKSYLHAIEILENRVTQLEAKVDDYEQEAKLDSLLFNGVKQNPSQNLNPAINHIIRDQMGLSSIANSDVVSVHRFRLGSSNSQRPDKVAPVLVKFCSKDIASAVFKAKKNLANSGIFVSENLTKKKRELLNAARDKFGNRCVWSDQGRVFVRQSSVSPIQRIWGIDDLL